MFLFCLKANIVQHCFKEKMANTIILIESIPSKKTNDKDVLAKSFFAPLSSVNIFGTDSRKNFLDNYKRYPRSFLLEEETNTIEITYQATSIVIIISSITKFAAIIKEMSESIWWNNEAFFLIINEDTINGCKILNKFFYVIWSVKVLSVLYLCKTWDDQLVLYTFNPYAAFAPNSWKKISSIDENWTLFQFSLYHGFDLGKLKYNKIGLSCRTPLCVF